MEIKNKRRKGDLTLKIRKRIILMLSYFSNPDVRKPIVQVMELR